MAGYKLRSAGYMAVYPPSANRSAPVMKEASLEERKRMGAAISRGSAIRFRKFNSYELD